MVGQSASGLQLELPLILPSARDEADGCVGRFISDRYEHILWQVSSLRHQQRARSVAERLKRTAGVIEAASRLAV